MQDHSYNFPYNTPLIKKALLVAGSLLGVTLFALACIYTTAIKPPSDTVYPVKVVIDNGQGAQSIARELVKAGVVRSVKFAQHLIVSSGNEKKIAVGTYVFTSPRSVFGVIRQITSGDYGYIPVKLTIPEGTTSKKIASIVHEKFPQIATSTFVILAHDKEGYLFPETYFFAPDATSTEIIARMTLQFSTKISDPKLQSKIQASGKSLHEILTVASILEEEVRTTTDRKIVADLLYRRIKIGMPLQVDATLTYITGKTSAELTLKDLHTDNPYNTYTNRGLPPTPISNPGLDSIEAVLDPTPNEYLFYLSDKDGITHFSKTHEEHVRLKAKYL